MGAPAISAVPEYQLSEAEAHAISMLAKSLRESVAHPTSSAFYCEHWKELVALPPGLRVFFESVRRTESVGAFLVTGLPVDDHAIGPTPAHWSTPAGSSRTLEHEIILALCGLSLGEPFTWATLQSGRMVQDILPVRGDEHRQNGHGSTSLLEFHTEDGFHPDRCDYLLLYGLRNHDRVPTVVASVRDVRLSARDRKVLAAPRFHILPDDEHIRQLEIRNPAHPALRVMKRMRDVPEPVAVLFGDPAHPYLKVDRPFMRCAGDDPAAARALGHLMEELERVQRDVVVAPGVLLVVDNYVAVHGRRSFVSRYDGTDRWLKKLTVRRDLRRPVLSSRSAGEYVLY
ncbi:guanitoxin biosynthesis L-enduracididine beta-hydroxylase GntD [Amycolatopsis vastitatis]|uniref:Taurine catabolism dioxygenase TauD n=1 Tax=Amycolatopsis vastitatis TaxID=1905142 RepID=A0A229SVK9_9PSEU|nr:guanitoxin biosynthesis L-enduracididine beta-hydroxylase GntD [Amycolatopsis vastitatis]OXM62800.1 taurine catabolism dioxygenase TauD [Amycolatopsis vastitatis]